jgi:hypothetical protein
MVEVTVVSGDGGTANFALAVQLLRVEDGVATHSAPMHSAMSKYVITNMSRRNVVRKSKLQGKVIKTELKPFHHQHSLYRRYTERYVDYFKPAVVGLERFMTRGLKGRTIEMVTAMNTCWADSAVQVGAKPVMITAAEWKNRLNASPVKLAEMYRLGTLVKPRLSKHRIDALFIGMYAAAEKDPYSWLTQRKAETLIKELSAAVHIPEKKSKGAAPSKDAPRTSRSRRIAAFTK